MYGDPPELPFLLQIHLSMAVPLKVGELEEQRPERRMSAYDDVPCEWCGTGTIPNIEKRSGVLDLITRQCRSEPKNCKLCGGTGYLPRHARNGQLIAERGDIILYRSKKKGETAKMMNVLTESLALLAFQPGGVTFGAMHFQACTALDFKAPQKLAEALTRYTRIVRKTVK